MATQIQPDTSATGFGLSQRQVLYIVVFLAALVAAWQLAVELFEIPGYLLPSPLAIARALIKDYPIFLDHTLATLSVIAIGLFFGITTGLILALLMSQSEALAKSLYVPILATQTTPTIAIAPILIIWFGFGLLPKVIVITIFSFFPVLVNTLAGLQATSRRMELLMASISASKWQVYRHIKIPMALPHVFAGFRLAAAASVIGAVVVEWVSSVKGLGYLLILYQARLNVDKAFATLIVLMVLGVTVFAITAVIEQRFSWTKRLGIE